LNDQTGDSFCQNDVRDRLAVSDDAVEVKNQCTRHFNSGEDQRFACLICGLASKWTDATESSRTLSVAWCVNQALPVRPPSACYGLDAIETLAEIALRDLNVMVVLQVEPKLCRGAECLASRSAVSAVMPVRSLAIRSIRVRGKPQALARAPADIFSGTRNSSRRTSPGCIGLSFFAIVASSF